jgi:hypothetical protein
MSMKGWSDPPPQKAPRQVQPPPVTDGFIRLGVTVVVPELALEGSDLVVVAVLEDPVTGDWFGEDPAQPGSALVPIDKDGTIPSTPEATAVLEQVAAAARQLRHDRVAQAADTYTMSGLALARATAAELPHPSPTDLAVDLGRIVSGSIPPAAAWWRTPDGVRLTTVRTGDDPLEFSEEWASSEDLLALDGPATQRSIDDLASAIASGPGRRPDEIEVEVRREALRLLTELAPELAKVTSEP